MEMASNGLFSFAQSCRSCNGEGQIIKDKCKSCGGQGAVLDKKTLNVKIPAGVDDGNNIRLPNQGDAGIRGAPPGHLFIHLRVKPHEVFVRSGSDVHLDVPITVSQAILGGTVQIPTLQGTVELKVPNGTQPNDKRVLRSKGIKRLNSTEYGSQYVHFKVIVPDSLSDKQKELIEEFAKEENERSKNSSFFSKIKNFLSKKK